MSPEAPAQPPENLAATAAADGGSGNLIAELEEAITGRQMQQRIDILRRVTDLFRDGGQARGADQTELFDQVMLRLVAEVDEAARAQFSAQMAAMPDAPGKTIRALALDESIAVAGPVLAQSDRLDEATLIQGARTRSQQHLLAISRRTSLSEPVTDVLVERGDREVVRSTAANMGAKFSEFGFSTLVARSRDDEELAARVWLRADMPRHHLIALLSAASETLQQKLVAADPSRATVLPDLLRQASECMQAQARQESVAFTAAFARMKELHASSNLTETCLSEVAHAGKFDETACAMSLLCELPIGAVERALVQGSGDQVLVVAKAVGFSWKTVQALLSLRPGGMAQIQFDKHCANFNKLKPETARTALQFYRLRERAGRLAAN